MPHLHRLSEISTRHSEDFQDTGMYSPVGATAYAGQQQIGTVRDVLVDDDYGKVRYLIVDEDGGSLEGARLIPIGLARIEDGGVYFDDLSTSQLSALHRYSADEEYTFDHQDSDERVLRGTGAASASTADATDERILHGTQAASVSTATTDERVLHGAQTAPVSTATTAAVGAAYNYRDNDTSDRMFKAPERLQLLEERLSVNKEKYRTGSIEIGKHVETRQESVSVPLQREEVIIERHAVTEERPVQGGVLGSDSQTVRVDLEAERAEVAKQAFVTEEIEVGKRTLTEQQTVTETVGREVLDVNKTGEVKIQTDQADQQNKR